MSENMSYINSLNNDYNEDFLENLNSLNNDYNEDILENYRPHRLFNTNYQNNTNLNFTYNVGNIINRNKFNFVNNNNNNIKNIIKLYTLENLRYFQYLRPSKLIKLIIGYYRILYNENLNNTITRREILKSKITKLINSDIDLNDNSLLTALTYKLYDIAQEIIVNDKFNINILFGESTLIQTLFEVVSEDKLNNKDSLINLLNIILDRKTQYFNNFLNIDKKKNINITIFNLIYLVKDYLYLKNKVSKNIEEYSEFIEIISEEIIEILNNMTQYNDFNIDYQNEYENNYLTITSQNIKMNNISLLLIEKNCNYNIENNNTESAFFNILKNDNIELLNKIYDKNKTPFIQINLINILETSKIELYLKKSLILLMNNYEYFSNYYYNNNLENLSFEKYFINLFESLNRKGIDLNQNNFSKFIDYIVTYIDSIKTQETTNIILNSYTKFIFGYIRYLKDYYNLEDNLQPAEIYSNTVEYITEKDNELIKLYNDLKISNFLDYSLSDRIHITYKNEIGSNYGGLLKSFFSQIEKQLNKKYELNEKRNILILRKKEINSNLKSENLSNKIKKYKNELKNINEEIELGLMEIENLSLKYDINDIYFKLNVLAISKNNKCSIYIKNIELRDIILNKIIFSYKKNIKKNIIYKLLLYKIDYKIDKYFSLTENNLVNIGYEGSENVNKIYNKIKKNNIEKINKNYILNSGKNNINNDNNDIIKYISDKFIKKYKIYKNLLDFYISHFIDFNINIDLLI